MKLGNEIANLWTFKYRIMDTTELPPNSRAKIAISHTGLVLNPPKYISWLRGRLEARGVRFIRSTVRTLSDVYAMRDQFGMTPDVIVNATGVGARSLGGVEDLDVQPIRCVVSCLMGNPTDKVQWTDNAGQ
jgi:D-amino-acid oxidase